MKSRRTVTAVGLHFSSSGSNIVMDCEDEAGQGRRGYDDPSSISAQGQATVVSDGTGDQASTNNASTASRSPALAATKSFRPRSRSATSFLDEELASAAASTSATTNAPASFGCASSAQEESGGANSIDLQLFECHRALMSVRESVDAKYRELERRYQSALGELADARGEIEEKDTRIQELLDERDDAKDELARNRCGDSSLIKGINRENGKLIRRMREMRAEAQELRKENEKLKKELGRPASSASGDFDSQQKQQSQDSAPVAQPTIKVINAKSNSTTRPRMQRRLSGEKRPSWFLGLGNEQQCDSRSQEEGMGNSSSRKKQSVKHPIATSHTTSSPGDEAELEDAEKSDDEQSLRSTFQSQASLSTWSAGFESRASKLWEPVAASLLDEQEVSVCSASTRAGTSSADGGRSKHSVGSASRW